ncbi:hypothetical protein BLA13014_03254 [Burkholderia aenigmatica]|uniref:DUF4148 domain-containing protein n=1 Tax=Burkholderia aenigmatica TaxID=2015348 RepID=A0A6P2LYP7_9BURK|nr:MULTISPECIES: hypothetical protein [Burkholderia]MDN7514012.1 hypothetical protein [Burkholderia sp. AU45251]VWB71612.1 hypothetical protein BLA13014_03254 [Burkholderia aenigmatica]HDR9481365.1 hypothetical protein [Burkholderia aenigmatica]HDR9512892.1 hypothetical protein [Burkholderia aenigmatica]HDR9592809.1 hypothetical protein [Burkholderia aenigmatica]
MKTHAIVAAALAAASLSAFAQPGVTSSGFPAASPHDTVAQATHRSPGALPHAGFVLAKIDQNNTPPDRGGDPSGRTHTGTHM